MDPHSKGVIRPQQSKYISTAKQQQLAEDDAEIEALEKALGVKRKKRRSNTSGDDELENLLDDLNPLSGPSGSLDNSGAQWLRQKRRKALHLPPVTAPGPEPDENAHLNWPLDSGTKPLVISINDSSVSIEGSSSGESFEGFDDSAAAASRCVRENPYRPPQVLQEAGNSPGKYVPPSLRPTMASEDEHTKQLRRQIQGLLNRMSEANMLTIVADVERLYGENPRHVVSTALLDLLIGLICAPDALQDTFIALHAAFMAAIYKIIGSDLGAEAIERLIAVFDKQQSAAAQNSTSGKSLANLISLLAELYNFQVVGSTLIYDFARMFVSNINEVHTELLLRIIRCCGPQLRQEDPSALKDIVIHLQSAVNTTGEENLSVRTKFMIEAIDNLRNNRIKTGVANKMMLSEHTYRLKKLIGKLNSRNLKATEPLQITLADVHDSTRRGKWWLVGASYKDKATSNDANELSQTTNFAATNDAREDSDDQASELLRLAKEQRMNTDIRRTVFITIMSASDFEDAYHRLVKLNLTRSQELEIPKIVVHCALGEESSNPYYTLISRQLCTERKYKMAFQFTLWDMFKRMGEKSDDTDVAESSGDRLSIHELMNLAKLYGFLLANGGLGLSIFKLCIAKQLSRTASDVI